MIFTTYVHLALKGGIIPACAGSTPSALVSREAMRDHPRMRGEHLSHGRAQLLGKGSSPHARGAPFTARPSVRPSGIIPACAGSTLNISRVVDAHQDHPRMRGEHPIHANRAALGKGSSPHARGAHSIRRKTAQARGIIPACAGSTQSSPRTSRDERDHPRMRGEHAVQA